MQIKIWEDFFLCFYQHSYTQILQRCLWTCICMSMVSHLWCYSLDITQMVSSQHLISLSQVITWPPDPLQSELCFPMNLSLLLCSPCSSDLQEHFGCARAMTASLPQHCQQESWMQPWAIWFPEEKRTLPEKRKLKAKKQGTGRCEPWQPSQQACSGPGGRAGEKSKWALLSGWCHRTMEDILFKTDKNSIQR